MGQSRKAANVCICNAVAEQLIREDVMSGITEIKTLVQ
jgi:bacterioferritin-associated ferredoxin